MPSGYFLIEVISCALTFPFIVYVMHSYLNAGLWAREIIVLRLKYARLNRENCTLFRSFEIN